MDPYDQDADLDDGPARQPVDLRRLAILGLVALVIIGAVVGLAAARPWTSVFDDEGVEPFTATRTPPEAVRAALAEAARTDREGHDPLDQPEVGEVARAVFGGRDGHTADGQVRILDLADGRRVVRIEGLSIPNGPGLQVLLSPAPGDALTGELREGAVNVGELVYNRGDSTYELPAEVDPAAYRSVVIWSEPTGVSFAVAGYR